MADVFISSVVTFEKCDFFGMDSGTNSFYRIVQIFSIEIIENNSERFSLPSSLFRTLSNSYDGAFCKNS